MDMLRTRLTLEPLDSRVLPDASPLAPPLGGNMAQQADADERIITATISVDAQGQVATVSGAAAVPDLQIVSIEAAYIENGVAKTRILPISWDAEGSFTGEMNLPKGWISISVHGTWWKDGEPADDRTAAGSVSRDPKGSIMGKVWDDGWNYYGVSYDQDGMQAADGSDNWYGGVTAHLLDANGAEVASTTTDSTGHYLFSDVMYGTYQLKFDLPVGGYGLSYQYTTEHAGSPDLDSDVDANGLTDTFILDPFQTVYRDAGVVYTEQ